MDIGLIKNIIPWISEFAFFIALLPQIILNYRMKSTSSLSNLFLIFYFAAYAINVFYIFGLNLPFAYKVLSPLCVVAVLIVIIQKFYYDRVMEYFSLLFHLLFLSLSRLDIFLVGCWSYFGLCINSHRFIKFMQLNQLLVLVLCF